MTAFRVIYSFFSRKGLIIDFLAEELGVCSDTFKRWNREGYTTGKTAPQDIVGKLFSCDTTLMKDFLSFVEKNFGWPVKDELKSSKELTAKEFESFLADFLYEDSKDKIQYVDILQARTDNLAKTVNPTADTTPTEEIVFDFRSSRIFASCGKETTVFETQKSDDGQHLSLSLNFEKTRLREVIPEYAGVYWLMNPAIRLSKENQICFSVRSKDKSISKIFLEIKPKGRKWMHESFEICVTSDYKENKISCENFQHPETFGCVEEITIVIKTESFSDEELLKGKVDIANLCIY